MGGRAGRSEAVSVAALVLAGGRGSRLGAAVPKPLVRLKGRALLDHVLDAIPADARPVFLNTNESKGFEAYGLPILRDVRPDFPGPLAGIEAVARSGLLEAAGASHLLVLPGDTPFLTRALLQPLVAARGTVPRVARHAGHLQPTVALWPLPALAGLSAFLDTPGRHAIRAYLEGTGFEPFDIEGDDAFLNVNTPADLEMAERRLSSG